MYKSRCIHYGAILLMMIGLGLGGIAGGGCGREPPTAETPDEEMPEYAEQLKSIMEERVAGKKAGGMGRGPGGR